MAKRDDADDSLGAKAKKRLYFSGVSSGNECGKPKHLNSADDSSRYSQYFTYFLYAAVHDRTVSDDACYYLSHCFKRAKLRRISLASRRYDK